MGYTATVIEVMIASPSDVSLEREAVREALAQWNALHSRDRSVVFLPVGWETHSAPDLSNRPQQLINERILSRCDLLIGIFWARIGSPTGKAVSGTVEEIQEHHAKGKPVMLYFSQAPLPQNHDPEQFQQIKKLKEWAFTKGLVGTYSDPGDLKNRLVSEIHTNLRDNEYLRREATQSGSAVPASGATHLSQPNISAEAKRLLVSSAAHDGRVIMTGVVGGTYLKAGFEEFMTNGKTREAARWKAALDELIDKSLLVDVNGKGQIFELTHAGFAEGDKGF